MKRGLVAVVRSERMRCWGEWVSVIWPAVVMSMFPWGVPWLKGLGMSTDSACLLWFGGVVVGVVLQVIWLYGTAWVWFHRDAARRRAEGVAR